MHPRSRLKKRPVSVYTRRGAKPSKNRNWKTSLKNLLKNQRRKLFYLFIIFILIMLLIPPATYLYFAKDLKNKDSVMNRQQTGLTLMDRDGQEFYSFDLAKSFTYIPISDIPKTVQNGAVATEDKNFYTNPGFSITGIARAFLVDIFA